MLMKTIRLSIPKCKPESTSLKSGWTARKIKPEGLAGWTLNERDKLFRAKCFLPIDLSGLIGVRRVKGCQSPHIILIQICIQHRPMSAFSSNLVRQIHFVRRCITLHLSKIGECDKSFKK